MGIHPGIRSREIHFSTIGILFALSPLDILNLLLYIEHMENETSKEKKSSYVRKTSDEWQLHVNYGGGWEHEISEATYKAAKEQKKTYSENCPQYPTKIVLKRVKIDQEQTR
jgi:hypothetical protein